MKLPRLFLEMHGDELFRAFQKYGEIVSIAPREPFGPFRMDGAFDPEITFTVVTVRCINDHGIVRFEALTKADQDAAAAWAEKHKDTTREEFDWLPSFHGSTSSTAA